MKTLKRPRVQSVVKVPKVRGWVAVRFGWLAGGLLAGLAVSLSLSGAAEQAAPGESAKGAGAAAGEGYELVAPLSDVMGVTGDLFARMPEKLQGASRRELRALRRQASFVAEMGNLVGQLKANRKNKRWVEIAGTMKTSSLAMAEAAGKYDVERFQAMYDQVKVSCGACHETFRD